MGKWMRRIIALAMALALAVSMAGCAADVGAIDGGPTRGGIPGTDVEEPSEAPGDQEEPSEAPPEAPSETPGPTGGQETPPGEQEPGSGQESPPGESGPGIGQGTEQEPPEEEPPQDEPPQAAVDEDGEYSSADDVALYLHTFGHLPRNFITKNEARELGWPGGGLEDYAPGCAIGGDYFGNREGVLPKGKYHECDIDTVGASSRGAKRLVYSDDGRIYYTGDHYETFSLLYGEE